MDECKGKPVVSDSACDKTQRPIVFVHGTLGSGDNIAHVAKLFGSNGYCQSMFVAVDYNSLGGSPAAQLDTLIDKVLKDSGATQVDLMGHSQGAMHCYTYLNDPKHAAKVAHYVHLAGGPQSKPPGGVKTLSLSSKADAILGPDGVTGADKTVVFDKQDHFAVASSTDSFVEIYKYLIGKEPKYTEVQCGDEMVTIVGKAETFGDNMPANGKLEVCELGDSPRERGAPVTTFTNDGSGTEITWQAKRGVQYEFRGLDANGKVLGHVYFAPFKRSDYLVRFLSPSKNPLAMSPTNSIVRDAGHTSIIGRWAQGAFRQDLGNSLKIDGTEVLSNPVANAMTTTVGLFMFDANKNKKTDGGLLSAYASTPFVKGTDVYMDATKAAWITLEFDGTTMRVPNWPSTTEGDLLITLP